MNTAEQTTDDEAQARRAFERIAKTHSILERLWLGQKRAELDDALRERGIAFDTVKILALCERAVCSLVLANRRQMSTSTSFDDAARALREWLEVDAVDVRAAMPAVFVTSAELWVFDGLSASERKKLSAALFGPRDQPWTTMAPRVLHRAIALALSGSVQRNIAARLTDESRGNDGMLSTFSAAEHVVEASFAVSLREQPTASDCASLFVIDPRCGAGTLLLATLDVLRRSLASREGDKSLVEATLRGVVCERLRGVDDSPSAVSIARLGLWLEMGQELAAADLCRAVAHESEADERFRDRPNRARVFVFSHACAYGRPWPFEAVLCEAEEGATVGMLFDRGMASRFYARARAEWDREFDVVRPIFEPRLRSSLERPRTLAMVARRRADLARKALPWANCPYGLDERDQRLLLALSTEPCVGLVADAVRPFAAPREPLPRWPQVAVRPESSLLEAVLVPEPVASDTPRLFVWAPGWDGFALFGLLRSTVVCWQRSMLANARGGDRTHTIADVLELAVPSSCDVVALREAGLQLAAARTDRDVWAALDAVDDAVGISRAFGSETARYLASWRKEHPVPTALVAGGALVNGRDVSRSSVAGEALEPALAPPPRVPEVEAAPRPPPMTPSSGIVRPTTTSAHDDRLDSSPIHSNDPLLGQGNESALRVRIDDRRAATPPGAKRTTTQPEGDAEREAFAILRAAGPDGLSLRALVRRAREHEEDEIREAISRLIADAWIVSEGEGDDATLRATSPDGAIRR